MVSEKQNQTDQGTKKTFMFRIWVRVYRCGPSGARMTDSSPSSYDTRRTPKEIFVVTVTPKEV